MSYGELGRVCMKERLLYLRAEAIYDYELQVMVMRDNVMVIMRFMIINFIYYKHNRIMIDNSRGAIL